MWQILPAAHFLYAACYQQLHTSFDCKFRLSTETSLVDGLHVHMCAALVMGLQRR